MQLPLGGRYTIRVTQSDNYQGEYRLRVTVARPPMRIETEANDSVGAANALAFAVSPGLQAATMAGYVGNADGSGDYFRLENLVTATEVRLGLRRPANSGLSAYLGVYNSGGALITNGAAGATNFTWAVVTNGAYYVRVWAAGGADLLGQYIADITLADVLPPAVASVSLPGEGTASTGVVDRFTIGFTEEMSAGTVSNTANCDLRSAGLDGTFGTGDDGVYALSASYSSGLAASYTILGGPLQPGAYRFTIGTGLLDRALNPLPEAYVRTFTMGWLADYYVTEGRTNDSPYQATSLSLAPSAAPDGTFTGWTAPGVGTNRNPWGVALGQFDGDGVLDLAVANYSSHNVSILKGAGNGTFTYFTNCAAGSNPRGLVAGDVNNDGKADLAVANYGGNTVSVLLGTGDGTFAAATNLVVGVNPYTVALGDLNGDGWTDLVSANYSSTNVSVRLNNGNGTFGTTSNYVAGTNPCAVALGDLNNDGRPDLAVANWSGNNVSVRLGNGDGTFGTASHWAVGATPSSVAMGDFNGDGKADVATANWSANNVSVLLGNGDGSFAPASHYGTTGTQPSWLVAGQFTGDANLDLAVANYNANNVSLLLGNGDGSFQMTTNYGVGANPYWIAAGDLDNDGRLDLAVGCYGSHYVYILMGNRVELLTEDPAGSGLRSGQGRGNLTSPSDCDYWSFQAEAGDWVTFAVECPGNPSGSRLNYYLYRANGEQITGFTPEYYGRGQSTPVQLPLGGRYTVRVTQSDNYQGEYRLQVTLVRPPTRIETEENGTIATANAVQMVVGTGTNTGSMAGSVKNTSDLDYYNLGVVSNGTAVLLTVRVPGSSGLKPVVAVYNLAGLYMAEAGGGWDNDGMAEVWITTDGPYYALVRGKENTGALADRYFLDVTMVPTAELSIPNLQMIRVDPPAATNIVSGQTVSFSWVVQNVRSNGTGVAYWNDRVALSSNSIWGDADDIVLGTYAHDGALAGGQAYTNTQSVVLPAELSGTFYLLAEADQGNAIYEGMFEYDNAGASTGTFDVVVAPYPDLKVEGLGLVATNDETGEFRVEWTTANRGTKAATNTFFDRVVVTYVSSGATLINQEIAIAPPLGVNGTVFHQVSATAALAGTYRIQVTTDNRDQIFEHDGASHALAEQNTVTITGEVARFYTVAVATNPAGAGTVSGGGRLPGGTAVVLTAQPNTNEMPYRFDRWTEDGTLRGTNPVYAFTLTNHRALSANFVLPNYQMTVNRQPPEGGAVSGAGTYAYGVNCILQAFPNAGYGFQGWREGTNVVETSAGLTNAMFADRTLTAVFYELNPFHNATTATMPADLAAVAGSGYYTNGQTGNFSAPLHVTNGPTRHTFQRFLLNGTNFGLAREFSRIFTTVDATDLHFAAEYAAQPLVPSLVAASGSHTNPVPSVTNYQVTLVFDRTMNTGIIPAVVFSNVYLEQSMTAATNGTWLKTTATNDTYRTPAMAFTNGMDGPWTVTVSQATDLFGFSIVETNAFTVQVNTMPPAAPVVTNWAVPPATNHTRTTSVVLQGTRETNTAVWINGVERVALGMTPWSWTRTGLAQGTNLVSLFARNALGNNSSSVVVRFYVDSVAPAVTAVSPANNAVTSQAPATVQLTFLEATSGLDTNQSSYRVMRGVVAVDGTWGVGGNTLTFTPAAGLADGTYSVAAMLVDQLANTGTFNSVFTVDTLPPATPVVTPVASPTVIGSQTIGGSREANSAVYANGSLVAGLSAATAWSWAATLQEGDNNFIFTARDAAGNESAATNVAIHYANLAPGPIAVTAVVAGVGTRITLGWSGYDELANGGDMANYTIYQADEAFTHVSQAAAIGTRAAGQKSFVASNLVRGVVKHYAVMARDLTGKAESNVTSVALAPVDIVAPPNPANLRFDSFASNVVAHWDAAGNPDGDLAGYRLYFNNATSAIPLASGELAWNAGGGLTRATGYPFRVTAVDDDGNESAGLAGPGVTWLWNPANVTARPYDATVDLQWSASVPPQHVREYRIYAGTTPFTDVGSRVAAATTTALSVSITGLQNNQEYYFGVAAVNASGGMDAEVTPVSAMPQPDVEGPEVANLRYDNAPLTNGFVARHPGTIRLSATDRAGIAWAEVRIDGVAAAMMASGSTNFSWFWNIAVETDDWHMVELRVADGPGNITTQMCDVRCGWRQRRMRRRSIRRQPGPG